LLPATTSRQRLVEAAVEEGTWLHELDAASGVLVTAQGLLMYLQPVDVHRLIAAVAARLAGGTFGSDAVPRWLARRGARGGLGQPGRYRPPPWTWGLDRAERRWIREQPGVHDLTVLRLPRGRGAAGLLLPALSATPGLRGRLLSVL